MKTATKKAAAKTVPTKIKQIHGIELKDVVPVDILKPKGQRVKTRDMSLMAATPKTRAVTEEVQVFTAKADVFGRALVPADVILRAHRRDVTLDFEADNFMFDQLFDNFVCDNLNLFVFEDVKIHLKEKSPGDNPVNITRFNGKLKMGVAPLSSFKSFLKLEENLLVAGEIETGDEDITDKITPKTMRLTSAASFLLPLADGIILKSAIFNIELVKIAEENGTPAKWTFRVSVTGILDINKLGNNPVQLEATVTLGDNTLGVLAKTSEISGLFNMDKLVLNNIQLGFKIGSENEISLMAELSPADKIFAFEGKITPEYTAITAAIQQFTFNDINDLFKYLHADTLILPEFDVSFDNTFIGFATNDAELESGSVKKGITIGSSVTILEHTCRALTTLSTDGIEFIGGLEDLSVGPVDIKKARLEWACFTKRSNKPSQFAVVGEADFEGLLLQCKLAYIKNKNGTSQKLVYAGIAAESFGLSTIIPATKDTFVDTLKFSRAAFIYSSLDSSPADSEFEFQVKKGLQLVGVLDEFTPLTELTKSKKVGLILNARFGTTTDISIEIPDTRLSLGDSVTCSPLRMAIVILPKPAIQMIFGVDVKVPKQVEQLHFDLMLEVGAIGASGSGTMKGYWENPFGLDGLKIGPALAMQIGIIYSQFAATGLPTEFGFVGGIALGDVAGQMGAKISGDPSNLILMGEVDKLSPQNLLKFAETLTKININEEDVPDFFDLEKLKLYCAPIGGSIGTVTFEPGLSFIADLVLFEKRINIYTLFNEEGIIAKGELDKIEIGPLKLKGSRGENAKLGLELTMEKQGILIDGEIDFLGTGTNIFLDISKKGASFEFELKFVDLLKYKMRAHTAGTLTKPETLDFSLYAEFENNLTEYIKTTLVQKINDAQAAVNISITDAQKKVDAAEKAYLAEFKPANDALITAQKDANAHLAKCIKEVNDQRDVWDKKVNAAQTDVDNAKRTYDNALNDARNKVAQAQYDYNVAMRDATQKVTDAQKIYDNAFNRAQADVDRAFKNYNDSYAKVYRDLQNAQNSVNSLQSQINYYQRIIDNLKWYEKPAALYYGTVLAGLWVSMNAAKGVLIAARAIVNGFQTSSVAVALNTAKATLYAVQTGGDAVGLQGAKQILEVTRYGAGYVAFQTAQQTLNVVQFGSQYLVWQNATNTLNIAKTSGRSLLTAAEVTLRDIGSSSVYIALQAATYSLDAVKQGTAAVAFESSKAVLEGTKQGATGMLQLSSYLASHAGDLLEVKKVTLAASLKGVEKGEFFVATFDGSIFNKTYSATLNFDVNNVGSFLENLFNGVLDEAKNIAAVAN